MAGLPLTQSSRALPQAGFHAGTRRLGLVQPGRARLRLADFGLGCRGCLPSRAACSTAPARTSRAASASLWLGELASAATTAALAASWSAMNSLRSAGEVARTAVVSSCPGTHRWCPAAHAHAPGRRAHGRPLSRSCRGSDRLTLRAIRRCRGGDSFSIGLQDRCQSGASSRDARTVVSASASQPSEFVFQLCRIAGAPPDPPRARLLPLQRCPMGAQA